MHISAPASPYMSIPHSWQAATAISCSRSGKGSPLEQKHTAGDLLLQVHCRHDDTMTHLWQLSHHCRTVEAAMLLTL